MAKRHSHGSQGHRASDRRQRRRLMACPWTQVFVVAIIGFFSVMIFVGAYLTNRASEEPWRAVSWALRTPVRRGPSAGIAVRFRPVDLMRRLEEQGRTLNQLRSVPSVRVRPPRLALVVGNMDKDWRSLLLLTIVRSLTELGYRFTVYALEDGQTHSSWEHVASYVSVLRSESSTPVDWSNYEGVILSSLEARKFISSLMEHPFESIPVIWLIQEDIFGSLDHSDEVRDLGSFATVWGSAFSRANVVVFPDFSLPMIYSSLDTGNFYVIPGSPVNVLEAESHTRTHSREQLRKNSGFSDADLIILVMGSSISNDELPWEYTAIMNSLVPQVNRITRMHDQTGTFKFVFLFGDSSDSHRYASQELASRLRLPADSVKHYGMDADINSVLLMADLALYGSFEEEQIFPPLLLRAMSFRIPIVVPNLDIIKKYVMDQVHGLFFDPFDLDTLFRAFSLLVEDEKLSNLASKVASSGKILSKNMQALDCIADYARLLENIIQFPSDVILPLPISYIREDKWAWDLFEKENMKAYLVNDKDFLQGNNFHNKHKMHRDIIDVHEAHVSGEPRGKDSTEVSVESLVKDLPTQLDWDVLNEMEVLEESDRQEKEEIAERTERNLGEWDVLYSDARKADKSTNFEKNERDEAELERIGLQLCIYEIYNGQGAWPYLHSASLYRGISLSKGAPRPRSDDVDAVGRLPILNTYYRDILCEFGAMFSIANKVDSIHTTPWIGFQSWRAAGKKVSLSSNAEKVLEQTAKEKSDGDVIYFWALMKMDQKDGEENESADFWSMCDFFNAGHCRTVFEDAFRLMYRLPNDTAALPPMPDDGYQWSSLHNWMMPTPSFLEFMMFSRMFVDSIDSLHQKNSSAALCVLGSSEVEKRHCYCRILEALVNIWAYHSARRMVYIDPNTGQMAEQHPLEKRTGQMWFKYFNSSLVKSMDEDLAEEADDGMHHADRWLWPLTGEVHWPGIFDKEREDKYRRKLEKKRRIKEKLLDRQKFGYKQKSLGKNR